MTILVQPPKKQISLFHNMRCNIVLTCLTIVLVSCGKRETNRSHQPDTSNNKSLDSLSWILGSWEMAAGDGFFIEAWEKSNDSLFKGNAVQISNNGDTIFTEDITIERRANDVFYIPVVKDQNNGSPILFKCTMKSNTMAKFENPEHDFPQIITYQIKGDSLVAEISGITEKVFHVESFPMIRRK